MVPIEKWTLGDVVVGPEQREAEIVDFNPRWVILRFCDDDTTTQVTRGILVRDYSIVAGYDE